MNGKWAWSLAALSMVICLSAIAGQAQGQTLTLSVTPSTIERGDSFFVVVTTAAVGERVRVEISDEFGRTLTYENVTDSSGSVSFHVTYPIDLGTYIATAFWLNETGGVITQVSQVFRVECGGRCIAETLAIQLGAYGSALDSTLNRMILVFLALFALVEFPRTAAWLYSEGERAKREGRLTPREYAMAPFSGIRSFIAPSRQAIHQRANERVAIDLERRQRMDELHRLTHERFWSYDPRHVSALKVKLADLERATERQRQLSAFTPRIYNDASQVTVQVDPQGVLDEMADFEKGEGVGAKVKQAAANVVGASVRPDRLNKAPFPETVARAVYREKMHARWHWAIVLFAIVGLPLFLMAVLAPLAYMGVYVEPLRPLWNPIFGDAGKFLIGMVGFLITALIMARAYVRYRTV